MADEQQVTWAELMAATSLAADTGMAMPLETGLATCLVSVELAGRLSLEDDDVRRVYRLALLQHIGCTAATTTVAEVMGDELLMREHSALLDFSDQREMFAFMLAHVGRANPLLARPLALARAMVGGRRIVGSAQDVCEAGQMLARKAGYAEEHLLDLARVYEHWDGSGFPDHVSGEQIPVPVQVVQVATMAVNAERLMGRPGALALLSSRSGKALCPSVVDALLADDEGVLAPLREVSSLWDAVVGAEPNPEDLPTAQDVDRALAGLGELSDLKSPYLTGHSSGVADLAERAGEVHGLPESQVRLLRRAGHVHDVGRIGVSSSIWNSKGPLTPDEWEQVRMHPHHTRQVLDRSPFLRSLADLASAHHERLDGSGYHRQLTGPSLSVAARILAAADTYRTKTEPRPHREPLTPEQASAHLRAEAGAGRMDAACVESVLVAAGQPSERPEPAVRLTAREVEILGQVARGLSMREIARALQISPKTVDGHLQRIYPKIGVSTRSGATLYAVDHGLLSGTGENSP